MLMKPYPVSVNCIEKYKFTLFRNRSIIIMSRLKREYITVKAMIKIYCKDHHNTDGNLCNHCTELLGYSKKRLRACPFQESKPTCGKCPVHCYKPKSRDKIKDVMRYSGPKMIFRHPYLAVLHIFDSFRKSSV